MPRVRIPGIGAADYTTDEVEYVRSMIAADRTAPRVFPGRTEPMKESEHAAALIHEAKALLDATIVIDESTWYPPAASPASSQMTIQEGA